MSEHRRDRLEPHPTIDRLGRERVAQLMRVDVAEPGRCRDASNDAPPGFGAQFTQISADHKQLIMRYVRNREPLFYDDL